jgi:chromatin remodeling complex protein RSC6
MLIYHNILFKEYLIYSIITKTMQSSKKEVIDAVVSEKKKKVKSDKKAKVKKEVVSESVPETVETMESADVVSEVADVVSEVADVVSEVADVVSEVDNVAENLRFEPFTALNTLIDSYRSQTAQHFKDSRVLIKKIEKEFNRMAKKTRKKKGNRSGFDKLLDISDNLAEFMGVPAKTQKSRNEVIKFIHNYIKDNELKNQENKKQIIPDKKLESLLESKGQVVEYFGNLQTFLKPHFLKSVDSAVESSA